MTATRVGLDLVIIDDNGDSITFVRNEEGWITAVAQPTRDESAPTVELSPEDQKEIERFFKG